MSRNWLFVVGMAIATHGCGSTGTTDTFPAEELSRTAWGDVLQRARGTTVHYAMWA